MTVLKRTGGSIDRLCFTGVEVRLGLGNVKSAGDALGKTWSISDDCVTLEGSGRCSKSMRGVGSTKFILSTGLSFASISRGLRSMISGSSGSSNFVGSVIDWSWFGLGKSGLSEFGKSV